jgi:hypothetical protein
VQVAAELIELLKTQHSHFDQVFNHLVKLIDSSLGSSLVMSIDEVSGLEVPALIQENSSQLRISSILLAKEKVALTSDISQPKKSFNSGSFTTKVHNDNQIKNLLQSNINILNVVDSNKDGLVAVCMDQEIGFYGGS